MEIGIGRSVVFLRGNSPSFRLFNVLRYPFFSLVIVVAAAACRFVA